MEVLESYLLACLGVVYWHAFFGLGLQMTATHSTLASQRTSSTDHYFQVHYYVCLVPGPWMFFLCWICPTYLYPQKRRTSRVQVCNNSSTASRARLRCLDTRENHIVSGLRFLAFPNFCKNSCSLKPSSQQLSVNP